MIRNPLHRAFVISAGWTLGLLLLGSVVHATGSSLACPDWPTCYGSMLPEMSGGVFWEHLHRLVAGGLILVWAGATWLAWKHERNRRPWIFNWSLAGLALLLVQAVLGGLTVIFRLPDALSTSHLLAALLFLALATVLAQATSKRWGERDTPDDGAGRTIKRWGHMGAGAVLVQSGLGAWVRHADAGLACPDIPLCGGAWVPPLDQQLMALHFFHRLVGIAVGVLVVVMAWRVVRATTLTRFRAVSWAAVAVVVAQIGVGFLSVTSGLAVHPVATHTVLAATLFMLAVMLVTWSQEPRGAGDAGGQGPGRDAGTVAEAGPAASG